ncbi:A24 family peptidase [Oceanobacillus halophilus]|uniref:Prepilin peptidase n=1 Tax=Oceanobacillus halophilus TaxID=930130 RepID=A0A495A1B5_9BACI|nr:A24 family peptidase [Oceanobacillus halophilus]RKQ33260.1 prepilin peptidase [Oceanobacillus halophilus]
MLNILLLTVLIISVITDLKSRKIYNNVIFPSLLLAFVLNGIFDGWSGLLSSFLGFLAGLGVLLIPYLMGGMGAGDVKLLALVGAIKGASFVFMASIYMALIGGLIGLIILLFRKGFFQRIKSIIFSLSSIRYGIKVPMGLDKEVLHTTYPYGVAIAGGAVLTFMFNGVTLL